MDAVLSNNVQDELFVVLRLSNFGAGRLWFDVRNKLEVYSYYCNIQKKVVF